MKQNDSKYHQLYLMLKDADDYCPKEDRKEMLNLKQMLNRITKRLFYQTRVMCCAFWKWLKELPYSDCPKCNKKGVRFSHEEHFTAGSPNVYHCKFCNEYYI